MLRISKKLLFAIDAVVDIAHHGIAGPVQSGDIAERQGIPRRYLEQVLQHLVRCGILSGRRGPRGGYRLARERRRITLGEIVRRVNEIESVPDPLEEAPDSAIARAVVRPLCTDLQERIMGELDEITIEDLCRRAQAAGIDSKAADRLDFSI
ncbi:MAG: Rrf2 family transcriptional regulator [Alphaproteobacteria bacterium]|nr:MAG: Rrf2 family transcriptional regulator [Alphaproteobacteria bacterium]